MKVISQLVRHFWQQGILSAQDAQYLLDHGFARPRDLPGFVERDETQDVLWRPDFGSDQFDPTSELDELEIGGKNRATKRGRKEASAKAITDPQLRRRVAQEFARRSQPLEAVLALANLLEPCEDRMEALAVLRRVSRQQFQDKCLQLLQSRPLALRDLWRAFDLQPFFQVVARQECLGRVAQSYFALLVSEDPALLGKYGWILQYDEMQAVCNLRIAHQLFLGWLGALFRRQPRHLKAALDSGCDPVLFWAIILLYNARRKVNTECNHKREYGPLSPPADGVWRQAWMAATAMDRKTLTPYLISCFSKHREHEVSTNEEATQTLFCPNGWHQPDDLDSS